MIELKAWEHYKQFLIIIPGFGIGLLIWFWVSMIAGLSLWLGIFLAVLITIIYEILACKYELHFSNMRKIVTIAIILGLLVFGATFALGSGEFIKEFHVTTITKNNMDEQSLMLFSKGGGGCVSPGTQGATITSTFSTWCFPEGKFDITIIAYSGCGIPSSENILKEEHFSLPLYPNDTDVTFIFVLDEDGNISVERQ